MSLDYHTYSVEHTEHLYAHLLINCSSAALWGCQPEFFRGFTDLLLFSNETKILQNLYKKVANTFISTARSQHQGRLSFMILDIHTYTCIQQQIHYVVMPNVTGIHQRWPPTHIFLVQVNFPIGIKVFWMTNPSDTYRYICR